MFLQGGPQVRDCTLAAGLRSLGGVPWYIEVDVFGALENI